MATATGFTLGGLTLVMMMVDLVGYAELVINRGFGVDEVGRIALYRTLPIVTRTLPFALLIGSLTALGRMGADREIIVLRASGISPLRLMGPVFGIGLLLGLGTTYLALEVSPRANRALEATLRAAAREHPGSALRSGSVARFGRWRIEAREVSSNGEELRGVVLWMPTLGETAFAQSGRLSRTEEGGAEVVLEDGSFLMTAQGRLSLVHFERLQRELAIRPADLKFVDVTEAASTAELLALADRPQQPRRQRQALTELHRRVAMPLSTALFGLIAVPLFLARGGTSRASGIVLGMVATLVYYGLIQLGGGLARSEDVPVGAAIWLPNAVLLVLALALARRARSSRSSPGLQIDWSALRPRLPRRKRPRRRIGGGGRRILDRYVLRHFLELAVLSTLVLVVAYLLIDVIENLKWFTKYQSTPDEVMRYYSARIPILVSRILPFALVIASALTVSGLAATGELLAMRACGVATRRTVIPILVSCVGVAVFYSVLANEWVPRASVRASQIKHTEIKDRSGARRALWYRDGDTLYEMDFLDPLGGVARGVTIYELDERGLPASRIDATEARHLGGGSWRLANAEKLLIEPDALRPVEPPQDVKLGTELPSEVETSDLSLAALRAAIVEADEDGYDSTSFQVDLHVRLAAPLACVVLPALALAFAAAGPPFRRSIQMIAATLVIALAYGLLLAGATALGYGKMVPPPVAGWGPITVAGLGGAWLVRRGPG
ncbi:MAG: LptF/LptG family permease [Myxococcota bacterium]|nr:LptF/LptG family permease [Myxococcota bacterium]